MGTGASAVLWGTFSHLLFRKIDDPSLMANTSPHSVPQKGGTKNKRSWQRRFWNITQGTFLEGQLTLRNAIWIVAVAMLFIIQGLNTYTLLRGKKEIARLNREITERRMEQVTVESELMGARRLSSIEERVRADNLDLSIPKSPPILIK